MLKTLKKFIEELRASDEGRRNRYLWGGSAVTMCVVILLWVAYLNMNVRGVSYNQTDAAAETSSPNAFLSVMGRGSAILYAQFSDFIWNRLNQKKEIIISADGSPDLKGGTKENFQSGELAPITPQEIK
ncbi:MAG: hypothetical protein Q8P97_00705 [bacterium]|nr:hypothetical protein [bacterium]